MRNDVLKRTFVAACLATCTVACASAPLQSAGAVTGTWTLVSSVTEKDGKKSDQFGTGAKGMMSLDAQGHFMLTIIGPDLPKFDSGNRARATPEESRMVVAGSIAMIGTYSMDVTNKTLTFHVERLKGFDDPGVGDTVLFCSRTSSDHSGYVLAVCHVAAE